MASIEQIIKDLEEIAATGGAGGGGSRSSADRKKAIAFAKEALKNSKEFNKLDKRRIDLEIKALKIAQGQYKYDQDEYKLIGDSIKQKERQIDQNEKIINLSKKVGKSFVGIGKAAFEGQGNISAFTDHMGKFVGTLGSRLDVNIETFRQLSQTGANFGQSIVELRMAAREATLPLDDFAKLVGDNSQSLAALFGSATAGAKGIALLSTQTRELAGDRLLTLGFTVDEINDTLLLNLERQRLTGSFDANARTKNAESAVRFGEELDKLAKLTGVQRAELRKEIDAGMSNERFLAFLNTQTEATTARLQAFGTVISNVAPDLATGVQDLIANSGVAVTDAAQEIVMNVPEMAKISRDLIAGVITSEQALVAMRDASIKSGERFNRVTQTGVVEFTRLQGVNGFGGLSKTILNTGAVLDDLADVSGTDLVKGLTSFEQATKVLASQFQGIETGLLQAFGPALGKGIDGIKGIMSGSGAIATALAKAPALTAGLFAAGMAGKFLFNKAAQIGIVAAGVRIGQRGLGSILKGRAGGLVKGAPGKGGGFGSFARSGVGRASGALGVGLTGMSAYSNLKDGDDTNNASAYGGIAGTAIGGLLGLLGGPAGALLGASLGGMAGEAIGGMFGGGKAFGGGMDAGKTYLTGEKGPEMITAGTSSTVTANSNLKSTFSTESLENKMTTMVTALNSANKTLTNMENGVNMLVAVEGRALKAVEKTARKDTSQIGIIS